MNTYNIKYNGKKATIKGFNLMTALMDYNFTGIEIDPQWRGRSNGEYIAYCDHNITVFCEWVELKEKLKNKS